MTTICYYSALFRTCSRGGLFEYYISKISVWMIKLTQTAGTKKRENILLGLWRNGWWQSRHLNRVMVASPKVTHRMLLVRSCCSSIFKFTWKLLFISFLHLKIKDCTRKREIKEGNGEQWRRWRLPINWEHHSSVQDRFRLPIPHWKGIYVYTFFFPYSCFVIWVCNALSSVYQKLLPFLMSLRKIVSLYLGFSQLQVHADCCC